MDSSRPPLPTTPRAGRRPRENTLEENIAVEVASPRRRQKPASLLSPSPECTVLFVVRTKSLASGTWNVTSQIDLGSTVHDEARCHDSTATVTWKDMEDFAAQSQFAIPAAMYLLPAAMRGPHVRKLLNSIADARGVPYVLRFLNADACLSAQRSVRVFSRQLSSDSLSQLAHG
jgi:hypothetical protein